MERDSRHSAVFETLKSLLPTAALVALLAVLATLQVRWLEQTREADQSRRRAVLEGGLGRLAADFNLEISRIFFELQPMRGGDRFRLSREELPPLLAERLDGWREQVEFPGMVLSAYLRVPGDETRWWRLHAGEPETIEPADMPEPIGRLAAELDTMRRRDRREDAPHHRLLADRVPALLVPLMMPSRPRTDSPPKSSKKREPRNQATEASQHERRGSGDRRHRRGPRGRWPVVIVHLDEDFLLRDMVPRLTRRYFGSDLEYGLQLVARRDPATPLLELGPSTPPDAAIDGEAELFGPLAMERRLGRGLRHWNPPGEEGRWLLRASHPAGSLGKAVAIAHRRNLALGLGILAVLAASTVLLQRNAARSRRLARQQLDFVAGITHELMTPLAALRSAGQNLADGVVKEPQQVTRYGRMIDREGRRLADLVGQALAFARMQSGQPTFRPEILEPAAQLESVLADLRPTLDAEGLEVEVTIEPDVPAVHADAQALRRALSNLIGNAVKYGQPEAGPRFIGAAIRRHQGDVIFEVSDRGPGIDPRDRPHLFEPFYRGRHLATSRVPGSGLGLSLVHHLVTAQGGSVELVDTQTGATFVLRLPGAEEDGAALAARRAATAPGTPEEVGA